MSNCKGLPPIVVVSSDNNSTNSDNKEEGLFLVYKGSDEEYHLGWEINPET
jgi:hypothetical protein